MPTIRDAKRCLVHQRHHQWGRAEPTLPPETPQNVVPGRATEGRTYCSFDRTFVSPLLMVSLAQSSTSRSGAECDGSEVHQGLGLCLLRGWVKRRESCAWSWHLYTRPCYPVGNLFGFSCSVFPLQKIHHSCLCRTNCISCVYN